MVKHKTDVPEVPEPSTASIREEGHPCLLLTSEAAGLSTLD